jgi:hypothetical protein
MSKNDIKDLVSYVYIVRVDLLCIMVGTTQ